ncbi:MAG: hypothetical protein ACXVC1_00700 [Tumebacillaceae bacterium]
MPSRSQKQRDVLKKRVRTLEAELLSLEPNQPSFKSNRKMLESQLQLAKAELKTARSSSSAKSKQVRASGKSKGKCKTPATTPPPATTPKKKRIPLPGGASFPSFQLPSPKSPTFYEDSLKAVGSLRTLAKNAMGYIQRADQLFDGLHGVGTHLHEAGVLPKIMSGKFKELNTGEWGALLMALMNSPLSGMLLGGGGGDQAAEGEQKALPEGEQAEHVADDTSPGK